MKPIPETYRNQDWPRRTAQKVNSALREVKLSREAVPSRAALWFYV